MRRSGVASVQWVRRQRSVLRRRAAPVEETLHLQLLLRILELLAGVESKTECHATTTGHTTADVVSTTTTSAPIATTTTTTATTTTGNTSN